MITLTDVHKAFGSNRVLRGVNLTIPSGESMVIIGGSGTGKSVLLKCILGLVHADTGSITLDGEDVETASRDTFLARSRSRKRPRRGPQPAHGRDRA